MKRFLRLTSLILSLSLLAGCSLSNRILHHSDSSFTVQSADQQTTSTLEFQAPLFTDAAPVLLWGRQQLTPHAQNTYDRMSESIACRRETPLAVDADTGEIQRILTALRIDHPEYFWFDGEASFVSTTLAGVNIRTECTFTYTMELSEIQAAHQQVQQYTEACLSSEELSEAQTDYEKILGVYRYIINHTDYILSEADQSIVSVISRQQGTCAGYARTFQYLMNQLGIPCTLALGEGASGESHGWNMVQCDGHWYQIDVTWGDPVGADDMPGDSIQYTYCLLTDQEIYRDHTLVCDLPMPECTDTTYNYFVQSGRQFDIWDPASYESAMLQATEQGETWFSVRFSNLDAYHSAVSALFEQGLIWDIMTQSGAASSTQTRVTYTQNDLFYEISVQLDGNVTSGRNET